MNVHEINYLTFSGGGGKGTAYLGAVKVLEEMGLLPIDIRKTDKQIKGLSGSSAGALMSYLLNLGYCTESADVKAPSLIELFRITDFDKFYDPAENGKIRSLNNTSFEKVDFNAKHTAGTISKRNKDLDYFPLTWDIVENISLVTFAKTILALRLLSSKFIAENIEIGRAHV